MATAQKKQFTLEDLNFGGIRYQQMLPEQRRYAWWGEELAVKSDSVISLIDKTTGEERTLFYKEDVEGVVQSDAEKAAIMLSKVSFPYADKPYVLINLQERRCLYDFRQMEIVWSQSNGGSLEWNNVSRTDAFSREDNLWIRMAAGTERQLSDDGSREIVYGKSVHREEFGIYKGTFFSPDGQRLAFYRMDQSMVADYPQVNTLARMAEYTPDKYPMAGMTSHKVTIGVHDIRGNSTVYLNTGNPTDRYFSNISWSPDGKRIYLYEGNRAQNVASLDEYDALTGNRLRTIIEEKDDKYVEPLHPISFLPWDNGRFIAWSQRDGYWHLYLYDAPSGKLIRQLTKGEWVVMEILGFNKNTKSIIIKGNRDGHLTHNIYNVSIADGKITPLDNRKGVHTPLLSDNGEWLLDHWSEPDVPRAYALTNVGKAQKSGYEKATKELFRAKDPWAEFAQPLFNHGTLTAADGRTPLHWRMVLPPDFDKSKKYPTVVYVYGGPLVNNIQASWNWAARSWEVYMAQRGYIIFVLDNRGSQHRGKDFEQVTWHQLGQEEMKDQMCGVDYLTSLPFVDAERLGIHGWSYGGYMTISLMTNHPDVFKVGVAGGPVIDWKWYEVMYGERYMGTPESNADGYAKTSLINKAKDLKGRLQIIIGMNDPTVVPQHALSFLYECNKAGTQPVFYVYPGEGHNMRGHQSVHLHERITRYFDDFLK